LLTDEARTANDEDLLQKQGQQMYLEDEGGQEYGSDQEEEEGEYVPHGLAYSKGH